MIVTLDEKEHIYRLEDGRKPPSVTQILNLYFPFPVQFMPPDAADIGTIRHQWFHELAQGHELEDEPDQRISGSVSGFSRFMEEVKPIYVSGEVAYFDPVLGVCGKPDLVAEISGRLSVLDYKPAAKNKRTALQTAAYKLMLVRNGIQILDRFELRLLDGQYRLEKHEDGQDMARWPLLVFGFRAATFYR